MEENDIILKAANPGDLTKIHEWLNSNRVLKYFGGRDKKPSVEDIEKKYGPKTNSNLLMINFKDKRVGFIDFFEFSSTSNLKHGLCENEVNVYSFDTGGVWEKFTAPELIRSFSSCPYPGNMNEDTIQKI